MVRANYLTKFREMLADSNKQQPLGDALPSNQENGDDDSVTVYTESTTGFRNLRAACSESWPWGPDMATKEEKHRSVGYIDVLQSACQRGFSAPPRNEVQKFQRKPLPAIPSTASQISECTSTDWTSPPQMPSSSARVDSCLVLDDLHGNGTNRMSEMLANGTLQVSNNGENADKTPTWISRVQKRQENILKARKLLER